MKLEILPPLLCYLSNPITNTYIKVRCSMISKILWIDSRMCRKNPLFTARKAVLLSKMKSLFFNLSTCPNVNKNSCFVSKFCILSAVSSNLCKSGILLEYSIFCYIPEVTLVRCFRKYLFFKYGRKIRRIF